LIFVDAKSLFWVVFAGYARVDEPRFLSGRWTSLGLTMGDVVNIPIPCEGDEFLAFLVGLEGAFLTLFPVLVVLAIQSKRGR
jgi:hypothetical protein